MSERTINEVRQVLMNELGLTRELIREEMQKIIEAEGQKVLAAMVGQGILSAYESARPVGWQPIATAPKDGTEVLVYCPPIMGKHFPDAVMAGAVTSVACFVGGKWLVDCNSEGYDPSVPSLWQHLPSSRGSPDAKGTTCKGCGKPLLPGNAWMTDGCPCNSPLGCNDELAIRSLLAEIVNDASPSTTGCNMLVSESLIERAKELCS